MAIEDFDQVTIEPAKLRPFSRFIMSIGELPTSYLNSLSYAEQVTWFCDYLQNNVIPALNNNAAALEEVQTLMTQLQEYVDNYFTNLDVQEEINDKLDQMAEDGTLSNLLQNYTEHKVIFMPVNNNISQNTASGDCVVLKTISGKVIMYDTGANHSYQLIKQKLINNNITKIDYIIISHYHTDHCENIENLNNDFDLSNTIFYLQKFSAVPSDVSTESYNKILNIAENHTIIYPDSGQKLNIDDVEIEFFNCNENDILYYDSQNTTENNYSMCCNVTCGDFILFLNGDIYDLACERIYNQGYLKKVNVMKAEHHGYQTSEFSNYNLTLYPENVIISNTTINEKTRIPNSSPSTALKNSLGANIYLVDDVGVDIYFNKYNYSLSNKNKFSANSYSIDNFIQLYVDSTYTGISDGTRNKPFATLSQALGFAKLIKNNQVNINIIGEYIDSGLISISNQSSKIKITGDFTCSILTIYNSNFICSNVITVTADVNLACTIRQSTVEIGSLIINGEIKTTDPTQGRGFAIYQSNVNISTILTISNKSLSFGIYNSSIVTIARLTGTNNDYGYICYNGSKLSINRFNSTDYSTNFEYKEAYTIYNNKSNDVQFSNGSAYLIKNGDDLNNYTVPGEYQSQTGGITSSLVNKPDSLGYAFRLYVRNLNGHNHTMQIIVSGNLLHSNSTGVFIRVNDPTNGWSAWRTIVTGIEN